MSILDEKTLENPIVLYNCEKKEPIGIFCSHKILSRYIYGRDTDYHVQRNVLRNIHKKTKIKNSKVFPFHLTMRYATDKYLEILGSKPHHIFDGYPSVHSSIMGEWHGTDKVPDSFILSKTTES